MLHSEFLDVKSKCTGSFGVPKNMRGLLLLDEPTEDKIRNVQKLLQEKILSVTAFNFMKESNAYSIYKK